MKIFVLAIIQIIISIIATFMIINHIEKHSVHPVYGNYQKISLKGFSCQPWDSCN